MTNIGKSSKYYITLLSFFTLDFISTQPSYPGFVFPAQFILSNEYLCFFVHLTGKTSVCYKEEFYFVIISCCKGGPIASD